MTRQSSAASRPFTFREEANVITCYAFRNGSIEDLHAGATSEFLERPGLMRVTPEELERMLCEGAKAIAKLSEMKLAEAERYWDLVRWYNQPGGYVNHWDREEPNCRPSGTASGPPTVLSPDVEARGIAQYTLGQSLLLDFTHGDRSELLERQELSRITDVEMASIMIGSSRRMAELLWLREHDRGRYALFVS